MAQCGDKPKRIAFGVAPLGIISIGIVPMGVISIGVVGMGVINAAVVGMGVVVAGVHAMGIWSLTPGNSHPHHSGGAGQQQQLMAYPSRQVALQKARELGCEGVHAMGDLWMPCSEHPAHHSTNQP
jgi:hypothetical protein